jgi:D-threo-aldose 1-dehydrogenase
MNYTNLGGTCIKIPPIVFGTSCLGNLYQAIPYETKVEILGEMFDNIDGPVVLDSAGKYGAGLALEVIGNGLRELNIPAERVLISNKLGWYRTPLTTPEPTFEKGAWVDLDFDAVQKISYKGILDCWQQGCELLGNEYKPQLVSVHDPDEYLATANSPAERGKLFQDVLDAYKALLELKAKGETQAIGVGSKDWKVIREISQHIDLDWVMLAVSYTVYNHPKELQIFLDQLVESGIGIVNSAVFNAGFLTGGKYFDYRIPDSTNEQDKKLFVWREKFFELCKSFDVLPANACVNFGMSHPGIISTALNTSKPSRVLQNIQSVTATVPNEFWRTMKKKGLIDKEYSFL